MSSLDVPGPTSLWRLLPDVLPHERARFSFFLTLSGLVTFSQTVGLAGSEALFLSRVGVARLPLAFVLASGVTVAGTLAYAMLVGRRRNDRLFVHMLMLGIGVLVALGLAVQAGIGWAPYALLFVFFLTNTVYFNHLWTFSGDYFDLLANKRLFPLLQIGASAGGFLGGGAAVLAVGIASAQSLVLVWAAGLAGAAILISSSRAQLRRWYPVDLMERDESSVEGIRVAARFLRQSALGRTLVFSTVGMVLSLFVLQYLYSQVFVEAFPEEAALATFLGIYLAVTNLLEIGFEAYVSPWLIQRLGVGASNLVHPVLTLMSFGLLAVDFRLYAGVLARVNREMLDNCLAVPVRALLQNAVPARLRGQIRAFLEGMVVHAGVVGAGSLLILLGPGPDPLWICLAGGSGALLYLVANLAVRRAYLESLVTGVRSGRVDLRARSDEFGTREIEQLVELWRNVIEVETGHEPNASILQLARLLARRGVLGPLVEAVSHRSVAVRRATVEGLAVECPDHAASTLIGTLDDPDPEVRLQSVRALAHLAPESLEPAAIERLRQRLADPDPRVRAEAAHRLGPEGEAVLGEMVESQDPRTAQAALRALPVGLATRGERRIQDPNPEVRAAALEAVGRLAPVVRLDMEHLRRELDHPETAVRRAAVAALAVREDSEAERLIASALGDAARPVRTAAVQALARLEDRGVALAVSAFDGKPVWAAEAALQVIARSGVQNAQSLLVAQLRVRAHQAWTALQVLTALPTDGGLPARFLRVAYEDALAQSRKLAFQILGFLEEPAVVRSIEKVLLFDSGRLRAEALEVLSHLGDREAVRFLVMTLERLHLSPEEIGDVRMGEEGLRELLEQARKAMDRWIRMAGSAHGPEPATMEETMERLLALRNVPLFSQMSLDQLEAINELLVESQYMAGEVIFREGDRGADVYLIMEGSVDVVKNHGSDRPLMLARLPVGSPLGDMAVLGESPRSATAIAVDDCTLLGLGGDRFKELVYDMPELAFVIFSVLTERLRGADERLERLVSGSRADELQP